MACMLCCALSKEHAVAAPCTASLCQAKQREPCPRAPLPPCTLPSLWPSFHPRPLSTLLPFFHSLPASFIPPCISLSPALPLLLNPTDLIHTVAKTGGHLGSSLGVVELTVAMHHVFNTPEDKIIWDVGHQAYIHKMLTGRRAKMHTIRQQGGLSGEAHGLATGSCRFSWEAGVGCTASGSWGPV